MTATNFSALELSTASGGEWLLSPSEDFYVENIATDTRKDCTGSLFVALSGENFDAHDMLENAIKSNAAALCIKNKFSSLIKPEWRIPVLLVENTLDAYQNIARFHKMRFPEIRTVAITGSVGKTSVKEIIRSVLETAVGADGVLATEGNTNNHVGVPKNLLRLNKNHQFAVIEIGTNHHGEIEPLCRCVTPDVAVVGSVAPCHLEFLDNLEGVAREKSMIFSCLNPNGTAIFPDECPGSDILSLATAPFKNFCFGNGPNADFRAIYCGGHLRGSTIEVFFRPFNKTIRIDWSLTGAHQAYNAAAAAAVAVSLGLSPETIAEGLKKCVLPGMRMAVSEINNVNWINDAYNANPASMNAALHWLAEFATAKDLMLILGDMGELGINAAAEHRKVLESAFNMFPEAKFRLVGLMMSNTAGELAFDGDIRCFQDSTEAASVVKTELRPGLTVLLKGSRFMRLEKILPET